MNNCLRTINFNKVDKKKTIKTIKEHLKEFHAIKWYMCISIEFMKGDMTKVAYFQSGTKLLTRSEDISKQYRQGITKIIKLITKWTHQGSGWVFKDVDNVMLRIVRFKPI